MARPVPGRREKKKTKVLGPPATSVALRTLELKIVILGNSGVGKSSILRAFGDPHFVLTDETRPAVTQGVDFQSQTMDIQLSPARKQEVKVTIWDTAGQERFRALTKSYLRGADVFLLVFQTPASDLEQDFDSLRAIDEWYEMISDTLRNDPSSTGRESALMVLCMSKCDRKHSPLDIPHLENRCKELMARISTEPQDPKRIYELSVMRDYNTTALNESRVMSMFEDVIFRATQYKLAMIGKTQIEAARVTADHHHHESSGFATNPFSATIRLNDRGGLHQPTTSSAASEEGSGCC